MVFGAGPVGLLTAQVARAEGAERVYVVDRIPSRLAIAASLGLEPIEADGEVDVAATLKRRHGAEGVAVAFECTGSSVALHEAIRVVSAAGWSWPSASTSTTRSACAWARSSITTGSGSTCGQIGNIHPGHDWASLRAATIELAGTGTVAFGGCRG